MHHIFLPCVYVCDMYVHLSVSVGAHMPLITCGPWRIISGVSPYLTTCFETGYRPQPSGDSLAPVSHFAVGELDVQMCACAN